MKIAIIGTKERVDLSDSPFKVIKKPNLTGLSANLNIVETGRDGGMFTHATYNTRDIEIEAIIDTYNQDAGWIQAQRDLLFRVVNPKQKLKIEIETEDEVFFMEAIPVAFPLFETDNENQNRNYHKFLLQFTAADPYLYKQPQTILFANIEATWEWGLELTEDGFEFGEKQESLIKSIYNESVMDCPIEIRIQATQQVINPFFLNVYTQQQIKLNTTLEIGDEVYINTGRTKEVSRIRAGVKEPFYFSLDLNSDFLMLAQGDNVFRFGAQSGEEYMQIELTYTERTGGI